MDLSPGDLVIALRRATVHLAVQGERFARAHGMNLIDVRALVVLRDLDRERTPATPGELGRRLGLASASATQLVDRLARKGLVVREPDPGDRRRVLVALTDAATASGIGTFGPLLEGVREIAGGYGPQERAVIAAFLAQVAELELGPDPAG